jgi:hypothetical protein
MSDEQSKEHAPEITPEELEEQSGELLPDREAMSVIEDPLRGPMPLTEPGPASEGVVTTPVEPPVAE